MRRKDLASSIWLENGATSKGYRLPKIQERCCPCCGRWNGIGAQGLPGGAAVPKLHARLPERVR